MLFSEYSKFNIKPATYILEKLQNFGLENHHKQRISDQMCGMKRLKFTSVNESFGISLLNSSDGFVNILYLLIFQKRSNELNIHLSKQDNSQLNNLTSKLLYF